jgi:sulfatase maturation enzyme AslB (radical SAM superfamily)
MLFPRYCEHPFSLSLHFHSLAKSATNLYDQVPVSDVWGTNPHVSDLKLEDTLSNLYTCADNLMRKNWPCNLNCTFCYCMPETNNHLLMEYNFTEGLGPNNTRLSATFNSFPLEKER